LPPATESSIDYNCGGIKAGQPERSMGWGRGNLATLGVMPWSTLPASPPGGGPWL